MIDDEVVLEALRVLCSDGLTSAQSQGINVRSSPAAVSATGATGAALQLQQLHITDLTHLALCGTAAWTPESWYTRFWGGLTSFIKLPDDIERDPKTGTITLFPDLVWSKEHLDPGFNFDFSNLKDTEKYYRGGEKYKRPYGWQRFALKVLDEYDDNTWLGNTNRETESVSGEWPVSYHGTQDQYVKAIIEENYKPGDGKVYGRGIYSTPDIKIAEQYATNFSCKKQEYKVIMQNRINPEYREICKGVKDYWLVRIEDDTKARAIVKKAIRPYGILLLKV